VQARRARLPATDARAGRGRPRPPGGHPHA